MKYSLAFLMIMIFLTGCGDRYYGPDQTDNNNLVPGAVEIEPVISPSRDFVYYVLIDSNQFIYGGIYRAAAANPRREKLLHGFDYRTPSVNFNDNTVAYLKNGRINYFDMSTLDVWESSIAREFKSIFYIREDWLLAHGTDQLSRNDSIYLIDDSEKVYTWCTGWDPTYVSKDTFVFISGSDSLYYIIKNNSVFTGEPDTLFTIKTRLARPRWPSLDSPSGHLTYCLDYYNRKNIYSVELGDTAATYIDSTTHSKSVLIHSDAIIYTGPDGRLYISNFSGTTSMPFTRSQ